MQVPHFSTERVIRLEMPYPMYRWLLYCLATYDNPTEPEVRELEDKCWSFSESLGAESNHHFIAENYRFMQNWKEQLLTYREELQEQLDNITKP